MALRGLFKLTQSDEPERAEAAAAPAPARERAARPTNRSVAGQVVAGRQSFDRPEDIFAAALGLVTKLSSDDWWHKLKLDSKTLSKISPVRLMELLVDLSPEVSRAAYDFILMCNPGYEIQALKPGTEEVDDAGQAAVDGFLQTLSDLYGSPKVVFNRLFLTAAIRGGLFSEAVFDEAGEFVDLATPDPAFLDWKRRVDPIRGTIWIMGQWQGHEFTEFDRASIQYIPIHPLPGRPQGRALFSSALFTCVFLLTLLHDLRRVISQQGYPRMDIEVDFEKLVTAFPGLADDTDAFKEFADGIVQEVAAVFSKLEPDQVYVHSSIAKVNQPKGALDSNSLGMVSNIFEVVERMATRALKTMPLLMATTDGVSEANANRQWEIHVAGIKSIQQLAEAMIEKAFNLGLQAKGIPAVCRARFAELRAAELLRDSQVALLQAAVAKMCYEAGWISQDEAAKLGAKKDKADQEAPRAVAGGAPPPNPGDTQADPGSNRLYGVLLRLALGFKGSETEQEASRTLLRSILKLDGVRSPTLPQIEDAISQWKDLASGDAKTLIEALSL